jgi:23S rRNA pseudouridine2457 synthase
LPKTYWVQVEGIPSDDSLKRLRAGVELSDGRTRPALAERLAHQPEGLWPRSPPVRFRARIPTSGISMTITEGRNRQIRRMTAAVGAPTLRLIRTQIGPWSLAGLEPGDSRELSTADAWAALDDLRRVAGARDAR